MKRMNEMPAPIAHRARNVETSRAHETRSLTGWIFKTYIIRFMDDYKWSTMSFAWTDTCIHVLTCLRSTRNQPGVPKRYDQVWQCEI